ncbi:MAG: hypothetical protein H6645_04265 [Caldilineaceae bacterium]|nr:hypothetical protein [Caldilineaceae bacterium]
MKQFEQCQMILQQELGVAVAEETFTLYERIKRECDFQALHNSCGCDPLHWPQGGTVSTGRMANSRSRALDHDYGLGWYR